MILAVGGTQSMAMRGDVEDTASRMEGNARITKGFLIVLDLGPDVIPDPRTMRGRFFGLEAGEIRALLDRHGHALSSTAATADQQLVDLGAASARLVFRRDLDCRPFTEPISWLPTSLRPLYLWSDQATWIVEVRRFGSEWIKIAEAEAGQAMALSLPVLAVDEPWQVRSEGACRAGPQPSE